MYNILGIKHPNLGIWFKVDSKQVDSIRGIQKINLQPKVQVSILKN